jgi:hypothetical protein
VEGRNGTYAVDRLDGRLATLVDANGAVADVPRRWLPSGLQEGSVIRVTVGSFGPDWATAEADEAASRWREALLGLILTQLRMKSMNGRLQCCIASGFSDLP